MERYAVAQMRVNGCRPPAQICPDTQSGEESPEFSERHSALRTRANHHPLAQLRAFV